MTIRALFRAMIAALLLVMVGFGFIALVVVRYNEERRDDLEAETLARDAQTRQTLTSECRRQNDSDAELLSFIEEFIRNPAVLERARETLSPSDCAAQHLTEPDVDRDPLGPYRRQRVQNRVEGVSGPALRYGETSRITGTLCSEADKPLTVLTTITWQAVGRTGTFVTVGRDVRQRREPGCVEYEFRNPMPAEVVAASEAIRADGGEAVWVVTGFEVPQLPDGSEGAREPFTSEPFAVVP